MDQIVGFPWSFFPCFSDAFRSAVGVCFSPVIEVIFSLKGTAPCQSLFPSPGNMSISHKNEEGKNSSTQLKDWDGF